jgi:mannose-6-phosphate isomerase-like protein (cupin superfamily)
MNTASFTIRELAKQRQESGNAWLEFLNLASLSMGVYHIPAGTSDRETHTPHDRDEIYVRISGNGRLTADGEEFDVESNSIIFVKAGIEHCFHDVTEDPTVLVFFAGEPCGE